MDVNEALKVVDTAVFAGKKRHLKDVEIVLFRGAWLRQDYYQIAKASKYSATYLKQDIGPKFWKLLTEVLGEPVSKTNLQAPVERQWQRQREKRFSPEEAAPMPSEEPPQPPESPVSKSELNNRNFVGRHKEIADINTLTSQGAKLILIHGKGGVGKSSLSWQYLSTGGFDLTLELWMAKETEKIASAKSIVEEWLRRHFHEEPRGDFGVTLEQLRQKLRVQTRRVGVLIDNLEPALDKYGKFIPPHREYVELLRVLADPVGNCVTLITSRERLGESAVNFEYYPLEGLDKSAWKQFFKSRNIKSDSPVLSAIHQAYGGNAKAMHIISGVIKKDWDNDIEAYWEANQNSLLSETDLQDLVVSQFKRLQQLDPEAYKLLYRLGCYRYQDVRSLLLDGINCLLWDVPESQRKRAVKSLRDRSLVEFYKGEYWLHPVIQAEARTRLKSSEDWKIVNHKAAEFWTNSVQTVKTIPDALKALEAVYHYIDIEEFDLACDVITKTRKIDQNDLGVGESLGRVLGRLGIIQNPISVINSIADRISNKYRLSKLYTNLASLHQRAGDMQKSIKFYHKSIEMASKYQELIGGIDKAEEIRSELDKLKIECLLVIIFAKMLLGENEEAIKSHEQIISLAPGSANAVNSLIGIAYIYSSMESKESKKKAYAFIEEAEKVYREVPASELNIWNQAYRLLGKGLIYTNLGEDEKAWEMFQQTIIYAESSNFSQVKGQALNGLAMLYRKQKDFETAIAKHMEAIKIQEEIGAKNSIADTSYEMGLTYQKMGEIAKSRTSFEAAIRLYQQMSAPRQVAKVQKAMESLSAMML